MNFKTQININMAGFREWLNTRCNDREWMFISGYPYPLANKVFKIVFDDNNEELGKILESHENGNFTVWCQDKVQYMNLNQFNCYIDKGTITNRDFCIKNGSQFLNYIKNSNDMNMSISDKEFIKYFSQIIYYNSGF